MPYERGSKNPQLVITEAHHRSFVKALNSKERQLGISLTQTVGYSGHSVYGGSGKTLGGHEEHIPGRSATHLKMTFWVEPKAFSAAVQSHSSGKGQTWGLALHDSKNQGEPITVKTEKKDLDALGVSKELVSSLIERAKKVGPFNATIIRITPTQKLGKPYFQDKGTVDKGWLDFAENKLAAIRLGKPIYFTEATESHLGPELEDNEAFIQDFVHGIMPDEMKEALRNEWMHRSGKAKNVPRYLFLRDGETHSSRKTLLVVCTPKI